MCFSATASFAAGGFLLGLGTLTLKSARGRREDPLRRHTFAVRDPAVDRRRDMAHLQP